MELITLRFHLDEKNRKKSFIKNNGTLLSKNCRKKDIISEFVSPILNGKKTTAKRAVSIEFPSQMEDAHCFTCLKLIQYEGTAHLIEVLCTKYFSNYDNQSEKRYK